MNVIQEAFGVVDGQTVSSFTLVNDHGVEVTAINYGCIITKIMVPDRDGNIENIVLGQDSVEEYVDDIYFLGAVVGRVAGRIKGASFELNGQSYQLDANAGAHTLHGGPKGFNKRVWDAHILEDGVRFSYLSRDGEGGFPGNLSVSVTYILNNDNQLLIEYGAEADEATLLTLTNHSYFNLSGNIKNTILNHTLTLKCEQFVELDHECIPTGQVLDVAGTPFDFTSEQELSVGMTSTYSQNVMVGKGYDHPFVLHTNHDKEILLKDPESGRTLMIETDEPAVVIYTSNSFLEESTFRGQPQSSYLAICLETQGFPDAIHQPHFPSVVLEKGEKYQSKTLYQFGVE